MKPKRKPFKMNAWAVVDKKHNNPLFDNPIYHSKPMAKREIKYMTDLAYDLSDEIYDAKVIPVTITERGKAEVCRWERIYDPVGFLMGNCGYMWPENKRDFCAEFKFCPFCGNKIKVMKGRG